MWTQLYRPGQTEFWTRRRRPFWLGLAEKHTIAPGHSAEIVTEPMTAISPSRGATDDGSHGLQSVDRSPSRLRRRVATSQPRKYLSSYAISHRSGNACSCDRWLRMHSSTSLMSGVAPRRTANMTRLPVDRGPRLTSQHRYAVKKSKASRRGAKCAEWVLQEDK
jgi:hypothetical protein